MNFVAPSSFSNHLTVGPRFFFRLSSRSKGEGAQGRVAAGAAAANGDLVGVDFAAPDQVATGIDRVFDIDHAPLAVQAAAIGAPKTAAAAIVDVDHGKTATGPELDRQTERGGGHRGRAAMIQYQQRRARAVRAGKRRISRTIEKGIGAQPAFGRKFDRFRDR